MACALNVDFFESDGQPSMTITFYGETEGECDARWQELKNKYEFFAEPDRQGRTLEEVEEIDDDELPTRE